MAARAPVSPRVLGPAAVAALLLLLGLHDVVSGAVREAQHHAAQRRADAAAACHAEADAGQRQLCLRRLAPPSTQLAAAER